MKIIVDFLRAEQHWNPDTGVQQNYLVFGFAGREHKIPCEEQDIIQAIRSSPATTKVSGAETEAQAEEPNFLPESEEDGPAEQLEEELLSGLDENEVVNPPVTFENPAGDPPRAIPKSAVDQRKEGIDDVLASRPRSRKSIKEEKAARMRAVAQRAPARTISQDDAGNPIVPESQQLSGPVPVVRRVERAEVPDDDKFQQG